MLEFKYKRGDLVYFIEEEKITSGTIGGCGKTKEQFRDSKGNLIHQEFTNNIYFIKGKQYFESQLKESPEELL